MLFQKSVAGRRSDQNLKSLVTEPLCQYNNLLGKSGYLTKHNDLEYHKLSVLQAVQLQETMANPDQEIINRLDQSRLKAVQENRERCENLIM